MHIIGIGVPLYQEATDMLMLAFISTMGSKNVQNNNTDDWKTTV